MVKFQKEKGNKPSNSKQTYCPKTACKPKKINNKTRIINIRVR